MSKNSKFFLGLCLLLLLAMPSTGRADIYAEVIDLKCNPDLNFFWLRTYDLGGELSVKAFEKNAKKIEQKYGLLSLNGLFEFGPDFSWQNGLTRSFECQLYERNEKGSLEPVIFNILLEGYSPNSNPGGYRGGCRSFYITVEKNKKKIIDNVLAIESPTCDEGKIITSVLLKPTENEITLIGLDAYLTKSLDEKDLPITNEQAYKALNKSD